MIYNRPCAVRHQSFTHDDLSCDGHRNWWALHARRQQTLSKCPAVRSLVGSIFCALQSRVRGW